MAWVLPTPVYGGFIRPGRPRSVCCGETTVVSLWLWWRMLVGGSQGGADNWSWVVGVSGREKSLLGLASSDAVMLVGAATLFEGRPLYHSPTPLRVPGEIL